MNLPDINGASIAGLGFVLLFVSLIIAFGLAIRREDGDPVHPKGLRQIPAFDRLGQAVGLAVEAGQRLHLTLGRGSLNGLQGASALIGLVVLQRIARAASASDKPPIATSGEGVLAILSQDALHSVYRSISAEDQYDPISGQLTGLTPFSYAAGTMPLIFDQQVSANFLAGHFGSEVALITDAAERSGSLTLAGSDNIPAQAVLYAASQEPLIGEELYAAGAYTQAGPMHVASLRAQDILRWVLIVIILLGAVVRLTGVV